MPERPIAWLRPHDGFKAGRGSKADAAAHAPALPIEGMEHVTAAAGPAYH
jgi:hypothetical protein